MAERRAAGRGSVSDEGCGGANILAPGLSGATPGRACGRVSEQGAGSDVSASIKDERARSGWATITFNRRAKGCDQPTGTAGQTGFCLLGQHQRRPGPSQQVR